MTREIRKTQTLADEFEYDVFLSHSHKDVSIVHPLAERLREDGLDDWEIEPGDSIPQKIGDGLERSRVLLMLLSENFDHSDWTKYESGTFLFSDPQNKQQRFVPVRLDDAEVPFRIQHFARVEWQDRSEAAYQKMLNACRPVSPAAEKKSAVSLPVEKGLPAKVEETLPAAWSEQAADHPPALKRVRSLGHSDWIRSVALTPDGQSVVSGSDDSTVRVWDLSSGECTATLEGHSGSVYSVALTPDGKSVVSAASNCVLRIWTLSPIYPQTGSIRLDAAPLQPEATRYTNAKVLLVGESGVGKTGLARWMATGEF